MYSNQSIQSDNLGADSIASDLAQCLHDIKTKRNKQATRPAGVRADVIHKYPFMDSTGSVKQVLESNSTKYDSSNSVHSSISQQLVSLTQASALRPRNHLNLCLGRNNGKRHFPCSKNTKVPARVCVCVTCPRPSNFSALNTRYPNLSTVLCMKSTDQREI